MAFSPPLLQARLFTTMCFINKLAGAFFTDAHSDTERASMQMSHANPHLHGFSLVELAVVLLIVALLLGGAMSNLTVLVELQRTSETRRILEEAKDALIGYAAANGRLPCPASSTSNGVESYCTNSIGACVGTTVAPQSHGNCSNFYNGMLPAVTLGLSGLDGNSYLTDGWGLAANRIRYAVYSNINTGNGQINGIDYPFTANNSIKTATISAISAENPLLSVCNSSAGITKTNPSVPETARCTAATTLSSSAVAVIYSLGKNAPSGGTGADEAANLDGDPAFVSHEPAPAAGGNEFDDIVTWLSPNILFNRMIAAGKLP